MIFKCMNCGKDIEVHYAHAIRIFCCKSCSDHAIRIKHISEQERQEERMRRAAAYREACRNGLVDGIVVKCIICGRETIQTTATPKLFCSNECRFIQNHHHTFSKEQIKKEQETRKAAFMASLSPKRLQSMQYARKKRDEFKEREAARLNLGGTPRPTRHCHNYPKCKHLTWDYYCPSCRKKMRTGYVEEEYDETESILDDFSVPQEAL